MAKHLARIHGTEEDRVNCPFYYKIGACRHGDRCSRLHHKPAFSQTLLFKHLYQHPKRAAELAQAAGGQGPTEEEALEDFLCFFEDMYMELSKFGRLEGIYVADNLGDHMIGHVHV
jgi:splicing factor U2AF subunit